MTPEEYLKKPYTYCLIWDAESQTWTGKVKEFPGCFAQNSHAGDAVTDLRYAVIDWIAAALDLGQEIPEPVERAWEEENK